MQTTDKHRKQMDILIASACGSLISTLITNPIQVAKLNRQYLVTTCPQYPHPDYRTMFDCECSRFKIQNSFRGIGVALPQFMLSNILYMQLYEKLRKQTIKKINNSTLSTIFAALFSRIVVTTIAIPLQSLRVRLGNLENIQTFKKGNGLKVTLIRDLTYSSLYWTLLQATRNYFVDGQYRQSYFNSKSKFFFANVIPAVLTGVVVSTVTTPIDTLKTRIQTQSKNIPILKGIRDIYRKQGIMGLFLGVQYRVLKSSMHSAIYLQIYQWTLRQFNSH